MSMGKLLRNWQRRTRALSTPAWIAKCGYSTAAIHDFLKSMAIKYPSRKNVFLLTHGDKFSTCNAH